MSTNLNTTTSEHDESKTTLGFWIYLMTDCVVFASLFATYAVLHNGTFGGVTSKDIFDLEFVLVETIILLTSSFTCGLALLAARSAQKAATLSWLGVTFLLGASFLGMELYEFTELLHEGNSWQASAFLSSFFTLVGTHGLHIFFGLLWLVVMMIRLAKHGMNVHSTRKLTLFAMFWHFLDVVWIFIFTMVYLMGAI